VYNIKLVDFQSVPDRKCKWILNYQDHATKFVFFKLLNSKKVTAIAIEFLSILLTFRVSKNTE
jgi:hypothetical protein